MIRLAALAAVSAIFTLALQAASEEAHVELPFVAPEGASVWEKDFLEVCSLSLVDRNAAFLEAGKRGWIPQSGTVGTLSAGVVGYDPPEALGQGTLQISRSEYPHLVSDNCMVLRFGDPPEEADILRLDTLPGVQGKRQSIPGPRGSIAATGARGLYSFLVEGGDVVTMVVFQTTDLSVQYSMNLSRRVAPQT